MVQGPVSRRRFSRRVVRQATMAAVGFVTILILAYFGWQAYQGSVESGMETDRQQDNALAKTHAQTVSDYFDDIVGNLADYAASESIRSLFEQADPALLAEEADNAVDQFPGALRLRLLLPGEYDVDSSVSPPLSYGSIDILNRVERSSSPVAAEVLLFGSDDQHIVLVARSKNQADQLIGIVHLSLDVRQIQQALSSIDPMNGYVQVRQSASATPLVLADTGNSSLDSGQPVTASIAGTRWTLAWWSGGAMQPGTVEEGNSSWFFPVLMIVVVLVGIAAAVWLMGRNKIHSDDPATPDKSRVSYAGAIRAIMDGDHPGMEKLVTNLPDKDDAPTPTPGISRGMSGDDITMVMKKEDLKLSAEEMADMAVAKPAKKETVKQPPQKEPVQKDPAQKAQDSEPVVPPEVIFRKYDIRGVVDKSLTPEIVEIIGRAIGSTAAEMGQKSIIVGRDARLSGPELLKSLVKGLQAAGRDVIDIGVVPTPVLYFATHHLEANSGVMLTGSHNGPEYNGLKIVLDGNTLSEGGISGLYQRIKSGDLVSGSGSLKSAEIIPDYIRRISEDIPVALGNAYKLVVDCGNGVAGAVAPQLFRALGHDVIELYCELDGNFPNHHPDPGQPENMQSLIDKVRTEQADLGFAFDGDGDRLGVVDSNGNIIWPDRQMMIFARDVLSRNQGAPIIFDVKCSSHLARVIEESGGKPLMWKTGHSLIKGKMKELEAPLAGEMSGHIFFKERWYGFDDALYAGARLLEILINSKMKPADFFAQIPDSVSTPELKIDLPESEHQPFMQQLEAEMSFPDTTVIKVDGLRVEFSDGWGLIRPSNTTPCLVVRFEADNQAALDRIMKAFRELISSCNPKLKIPF